MGEVDTKSIESVQAALSLFGGKNDQRKHSSVGSEGSVKEEWELMLTVLANYKVQLEVKEYAYKQALLKLETCQITNEELCGQLKKCEAERDRSIEDCREARKQMERLEVRVKEMTDLFVEARNSGVQLVHVVNELNAAKEELLVHAVNELNATKGELDNVKAELLVSKESEVSAMKQVEQIETAFQAEKAKTEELMRHLSEFSETVPLSKLAAIEVVKENPPLLSENEIAMAATEVVHAKEQLVALRESMQKLEKQLSSKNLYVNSLQLELKQAEELHSSSEQAASSAISALIQLKSEFELVERETGQLQSELLDAKAELDHMNVAIDILTCKMENATYEIDELNKRESEGQVEIALLKAEIHKGRSMVAAAESAEASAKSVKSGLYLAVKQLATEAEAARKETKMLKLGMENAEAEIGNSTSENQMENAEEVETGSFFTFGDLQVTEYMHDLELANADESATEVEVKKEESNTWVKISKEEYDSLIQKAQTMDQVELSQRQVASHLLECEIQSELNDLKNELECATIEIEELKSLAEQAMLKAELAERAKTAIEDQLRKWRKHKQDRRAVAIAALREELSPRESSPPRRNFTSYNNYPTPYQPLGKILNMKYSFR